MFHGQQGGADDRSIDHICRAAGCGIQINLPPGGAGGRKDVCALCIGKYRQLEEETQL